MAALFVTFDIVQVTGRKTVNAASSDFLADVLRDNGVSPDGKQFSIDSRPISKDAVNQTLETLGIENGTSVGVVVKSQNA